MYKFKVEDKVSYIDYKDTEIILDIKNLEKFIFVNNCKYKIPKWNLDNNNNLYTKNTNDNKIYFIDIIYGKKIKDNVIFKDNNYLNFLEDNIEIKSDIEIDKKYQILEIIQGHIKNVGKSAGKELNICYKVLNTETKEEPFILMFCKENTFTKIDIKYYDKIQKMNDYKLTWYHMKNGYIGSHYTENKTDKIIYLHQLIANWYGNGKGNMSVDHINRDKLDNRFENLRIVNQSDQNKNMDKKKRKYNAKKLPDNINELPKYVVYYKECYNKKENKWREFFKIEKHDKLDKPWCTSKSEKVGILDKLEQVNQKLYELNNNIKNEENKLPKYITYRNNTLIFYKKTNEKRFNMKMKTNNIDNDLPIFLNKIKEKYDI